MDSFIHKGHEVYIDISPEEAEELLEKKKLERLRGMTNGKLLIEYAKLVSRGSDDAFYAYRVILERMSGEYPLITSFHHKK